MVLKLMFPSLEIYEFCEIVECNHKLHISLVISYNATLKHVSLHHIDVIYEF